MYFSFVQIEKITKYTFFADQGKKLKKKNYFNFQNLNI